MHVKVEFATMLMGFFTGLSKTQQALGLIAGTLAVGFGAGASSVQLLGLPQDVTDNRNSIVVLEDRVDGNGQSLADLQRALGELNDKMDLSNCLQLAQQRDTEWQTCLD
jgi:hypothetical protein